jgi:hypothetical protein
VITDSRFGFEYRHRRIRGDCPRRRGSGDSRADDCDVCFEGCL